MRRVFAVATLVPLLALAPLWAQHGGGHASAGGHGGMAAHGGFSGHSGGQSFGGAHSFGGARAGAGFGSHAAMRGSSRQSFSSRNFSSRNFNRFRGPRTRGHGFRNNCYGYGCGWGWGYPYYPYLGGGIDPYWWWDSGSSYDPDKEYEIGQANEMNAQSLEEQRMRQQGDQDAYAQSAPPPPPRDEERTDPAPPTVLVFRDQHKQEVQNYAIVGQTLWTFAPQHTQKIPLSDLDLPATTKANDERSVSFRVPGTGEGQ